MPFRPAPARRLLPLLGLLALGACGGEDPVARPEGDAGVPAPPAPPPETVEPPPELPREQLVLSGHEYRAYGRPTDTFRVVCQEPCAVDEAFLLARHQGFAAVKDGLVALAGMDVLPQLTPVYLHVEGDALCGSGGGSYSGAAFMHWTGTEYRGSHVCLFDVEASRAPPPNVPRPLTVTAARSLEAQMLPLHEYAHVLLFLRHEVSYEWWVRPLSYRLTGFITSLCDERLVTYGARTAYELCTRHGLDWEDFTWMSAQLAQLYAEGRGTVDLYSGGRSTSAYQLRALLSERLGADTLAACVAGGELRANQWGDSAVLTPAAGPVSMYAGDVEWSLSAGAVSAPLTLLPGTWTRGMVVPEAWGPFMWAHNYEFLPALTFGAPVQLTLRFDPALLPAGADPATLGLWYASEVPGQLLPASRVDLAAGTVTATVSRTGRYLLAPR
jgi:hypothetical protein